MKTKELVEVEQERVAIVAEIAAHDARKAGLLAFFGVTDLKDVRYGADSGLAGVGKLGRKEVMRSVSSPRQENPESDVHGALRSRDAA